MTKPAAARKLRNFHDQLMATYGPQQWWPAQTPLEVIVGAYLTQNTSWREWNAPLPTWSRMG